jgi:hypothetical protein
MPGKAFATITSLACLLLLFAAPFMAANTQAQTVGGQNGTLYWSPVTLGNSSTTFSIQDATGINYSIYDKLGAESVHLSVITAQLYLNGVPYHMAGIPITFSSDNDSVAVLESDNRTRPSDANGQAKIMLIAQNREGIVNITATSVIYYGYELSDTCTVHVVGWGTVSGIVTDQNRNGIPDATVTLWYWNGTANTQMLAASDNPQLSNDGSTAATGMYTFVYVPVGSYNVTAEMDGHSYYSLFNMNEGEGTVTANVAIPDYSYIAPVMPTPTPSPGISATPVPSSTAQPTPTPAVPALLAACTLLIAALLIRSPVRKT